MADVQIKDQVERTSPVSTDMAAIDDAAGGTWHVKLSHLGVNEYTSWVPTITSISGTITSYTLNRAEYIPINAHLYWVEVDVTINNKGTADGALICSLPFTSATYSVGFGTEVLAHATFVQVITAPATSAYVYLLSVATPFINGYRWAFNFPVHV